MKGQHHTLQGEDTYKANLRTHRRPAPAKRKAVSAVPSEHAHEQEHDLFGGLALLVPERIAAVSARTKWQ